MIKEFIIILLIIHGAIHLLGFAKGFGVKELDQFENMISKPYGLLWLLCAILFIASALLLLIGISFWIIVAIGAVLLSQALIIRFWLDAKTGAVINAILIIAIIVYFNLQ